METACFRVKVIHRKKGWSEKGINPDTVNLRELRSLLEEGWGRVG